MLWVVRVELDLQACTQRCERSFLRQCAGLLAPCLQVYCTL